MCCKLLPTKDYSLPKITKTQTDSGSQLPRPMSIYALRFRMSTNRAGMRLPLGGGSYKTGSRATRGGMPGSRKILISWTQEDRLQWGSLFRGRRGGCRQLQSAVLQSNYERSHFLPQQVSPQCAGAASKREGALRAHSLLFWKGSFRNHLVYFFLSFKWASEPRDRYSGNKKKKKCPGISSWQAFAHCLRGVVQRKPIWTFDSGNWSSQLNRTGVQTGFTHFWHWTDQMNGIALTVCSLSTKQSLHPHRQHHVALIHLWGLGRKSCNQLQNL